MIFTSIAEVISIGAILPFLSAVTSPNLIIQNPQLQPLIIYFDLNTPSQVLAPLTILFVAAVIVSAGMRLILLWFQTKLGHAIGADLSFDVYERMLYQPYAVHINSNSGDIISTIANKVNVIVNQVVLPLLIIASSAVIIASIGGVLVMIDPIVAAAVALVFGFIYFVIVLLTKNTLIRNSRQISDLSNKVIRAMQEGLGGIRDILIDGTQKSYCKMFSDADLPLRQASANTQIIAGSPRFVIEAIGMISIAIVAYVVAGTGAGIVQAIPTLGALAVGAQRLLPVLQQAYSAWSSLRGGQATLSDTLELLDQPVSSNTDVQRITPLPFQKSIVLKHVSFKYAPEGPLVLSDINLEIPKGSRVGFVGNTGSGKSTIMDLIMTLLTPTSGYLIIDDLPITEQNSREWRAHISHVPQYIYLTDNTIAENIAFGIDRDEIDMTRVERAAREAQISQLVESLPEKYQTIVGERGVRLSGGQRQRLGIARALYKKADVLIFDEATSALDSDTESSVMDAIDRINLDVTVLIVAHRVTTLRNCDLIIELEGGKIKAEGSYAQVIVD
jgi:ABC-type multidrug transport system fused ATPase/permease subunit